MNFIVRCTCGASLRLSVDHADRRSRCPKCKQDMRIPQADFFEAHQDEVIPLEELPHVATKVLKREELASRELAVTPSKADTKPIESAPETLPASTLAGRTTPPEESPQSSDESDLEPPEDWREGDVVQNRYRIFGSARGAMGRVYFADHIQWKTRLAIKTILPKSGIITDKRVKRFRRETEAWINLGKHPNLVTAFYLRQLEGRLGLFLEYVDAGDLHQWIWKGGERDLDTILDLAIQICDGMAHAHSRGIIHRDLKPTNILLDSDGIAKVTDFGLVKIADEEVSELEQTKRSVGTPAYMAPEQFVDSRAVDARADIYSFGLILYMMLCRDYVFRPEQELSLAENRKFFRHAHQEVAPVPPSARRPDIPEDLNGVILRCLMKHPVDRYPDFLSLREKLVEVYQKVIGQPYPRQQMLAPELNSADLNNRALTMEDLDEPETALEYLQQAYEIDPGSPVVCANLLLKWSELHLNPPEATACLETAGAKAGQVNELSERLAAACFNLHHLKEAEAFAARKSPSTAEDYNFRAAVEGAAARTDSAGEWIAKALETEPQNIDLLHNLAVFEFESGNLNEAAATLHKAIQLDPDDAVLIADLAVVLAEAGQYDQAVTWCEHALATSPENFRVCLTAAEVFSGRKGWNTDRLPDAVDLYRKLFERFPQHLRVRRGYRYCLAETGAIIPDELEKNTGWQNAEAESRQWLRLARSGAPSPFDLKRLEAGEVEFGATKSISEETGDDDEDLMEKFQSSILLSLSPNGQWSLTSSGEEIRIRRSNTMGLIRSISLSEAAVIKKPDQEAGGADSVSVAWSEDSRFCLLKMVDGSERVLDLATAADLPLSPLRFKMPSLLLEQTSSAGETLELLEEREKLLLDARKAEDRWDFSEAFRAYRQVAALRGFERDFDAHAGATRAANWITAPTGLRSGWERKQYPLQSHTAPIHKLAIVSDGKRGLSLGRDGRLRLSDMITGQVLWSLDAAFGWIEDIALSPETNTCLVLGNDRVLRSLNLNSQVTQTLVRFDGRRILSMCLSEDSRRFFTFSSAGDIEHWTLDPELEITRTGGLGPDWVSVLFSADRKNVLTLSQGRQPTLWQCSDGEALQTFPFECRNGESAAARLSPSAEKLIIPGEDPTVLEVWNSKSGECDRRLADHHKPVSSIAIDSKGRHALAGCTDGTIKLWSLTKGENLRTFSGHTDPVTALLFSPNDDFFVSGSESGALKFWALDWSWGLEES